jgi:hypothetical protein
VLYKRIVGDALDAGLLRSDELVGETDEGVLFRIGERARADGGGEAAARVGGWVDDLRLRRLPKRAGEVVAADLSEPAGEWVEMDSPLKRRVEESLATTLELPPGGVFLDYPEKLEMFGLDLLVVRRGGRVARLGPGGQAGLIGLPRVSNELYRTARVMRLFTHGERRTVAAGALAALAMLNAGEIEERLAKGSFDV